jgi:hypothetical protein
VPHLLLRPGAHIFKIGEAQDVISTTGLCGAWRPSNAGQCQHKFPMCKPGGQIGLRAQVYRYDTYTHGTVLAA